MTDDEWKKILKYFTENAQEHIPVRKNRNLKEQIFFQAKVLKSLCRTPTITAIDISGLGDLYAASEENISKYSYNRNMVDTFSYKGPITQLNLAGTDSLYLLNAGLLAPHDQALGSLEILDLKSQKSSTLLSDLKRPVYFMHSGQTYFISQFGHTAGLTSRNTFDHDNVKSEVLLSRPGCYKMTILDYDQDGQDELITICSQALEGVYAIDPAGKNSVKKLLAFPPHYGLSDFVMCDINGDQAMDIVVTFGDNADYSNVPKEYHGVYVYLNDLDGHFDLSYFYPMYGATQVQTIKLTEDGQSDLIVSAYFANAPEESILIFKNQSSGVDSVDFQVFGLDEAVKGRWLVMTKGDIDGDGDDDIALGSNINGPTAIKDDEWPDKWFSESVDVLLLINRSRN